MATLWVGIVLGAVGAILIAMVRGWSSSTRARDGAASDTSVDRNAKRYLLGFASGCALTVLFCIGVIEVLVRVAPDYLPPPAISNQISFDEKLLFLRQNPQLRPHILGIGSSTAMRSLDGAAFQETDESLPDFLNASLAGGQINQIRYVSGFYVDLFPKIDVLLQLAVPPDFTDCTRTEGAFFDREDGREFASGRMSMSTAYLKYFNPHELIPAAMHIAADRRNWTEDTKVRLYMDAYGSMPMQVPADTIKRRHEELYSSVSLLDSRCFEELRAWSRETAEKGIRLYVVIPPISPYFLRGVQGAEDQIENFVARLRESLRGEPATLIDARQVVRLGEGDFADAYHLQWTAAQRLSREIAGVIQRDMRHTSFGPVPEQSSITTPALGSVQDLAGNSPPL